MQSFFYFYFFLEVIFFGVFFGQVWGNLGKNPSHPKHLPAPTPMLRLASHIVMLFLWCFR